MAATGKGRVVAKERGYTLYENGELWKGSGVNAYLAGYVMDAENISYAIDVAEEEMAYMMAEAAAEFGA
tara:strand:- start:221 stop:427 length:207 start_codon:yes stop_codon:yes gene_type:complete